MNIQTPPPPSTPPNPNPLSSLLPQAWDMRDNAVARKNACEIELARTRIDVMQINSQLMEAIQQKVELSQQLEQWQVSAGGTLLVGGGVFAFGASGDRCEDDMG